MSKQNDNTKPSHENRPVMLEWPGKGEVGECTGVRIVQLHPYGETTCPNYTVPIEVSKK